MSLLSKLFGGQTASTTSSTGRTPRERARREKEICRIDRGAASWERRGGIGRRWEK